ncbi:MAG: branched-chain amino acid ABC transporter permease [Anaerolineales bacterium]|nr:branched-chain amino acid ABC transporter permease [Anaerolineales bacterium]
MKLTWLRRLSGTDLVMFIVGLTLLAAIVYGSIVILLQGKYTLDQWENLVVYGLTQGSIYALIALGYTLVYGILRMINFAHSEVFMAGPFTAFFVARAFNTSGFLNAQPLLAMGLVSLVAMVVSMGVALLVERIAYRPLRAAPRLVSLITAIGASYVLQYVFRGLYGNGIERYPELNVLQGEVILAGVRFLRTQVVVIIAALLLMAALYAFVQLTKVGKAMRAVSEDQEAAALMGINVDAIIATTFAVGGALAGAAGILYALIFGQVQFIMGFVPGIKAFTAAVLGGIGNVPGAMVGGLFLGVFESVGPSLFLEGLGIPAPAQLKDVIAFTVLVLILIFRPSGILGERLSTKKA